MRQSFSLSDFLGVFGKLGSNIYVASAPLRTYCGDKSIILLERLQISEITGVR